MFARSPFPFRLSNGGTIGVAVFFVISSIYAARGIEKINNFNFFSYMVGKLKRLYPAYFVSVIIIFLVTTIYYVPELSVNFVEFLANIFLLQRFTGINAVDGAHWYISFLLVMYFWIAVFHIFKIEKRCTTYIVWLLISTLFSTDFYSQLAMSSPLEINSKINAIINIVTLERYSAYIIGGIMLFFLSQKLDIKYVVVLIMCVIRNTVYVGGFNIGIIVILGLAVYMAYIGKLHFRQIYILDYLASISYALYLIHQNIGYVILEIFNRAGMTSEIVVIVPILISLGLATFITYKVEQPVQKYFRRNKENENKYS